MNSTVYRTAHSSVNSKLPITQSGIFAEIAAVSPELREKVIDRCEHWARWMRSESSTSQFGGGNLYEPRETDPVAITPGMQTTTLLDEQAITTNYAIAGLPAKLNRVVHVEHFWHAGYALELRASLNSCSVRTYFHRLNRAYERLAEKLYPTLIE